MIGSGCCADLVISGGFFRDSGAQERFGVVQMGRPKLQCFFRDAGDQGIQKHGMFIVQRGHLGVPGAKKCHQEADLCGNRLKEPAQPWRVRSCHDCRMKAHVSLCRCFPILVIPDFGKPRQGFPDRLRIGALADRPDRLKFDESAHAKYVGDVLDGETTDPCTLPGFAFQEAISDEALYRNAGSGPRNAQLLGNVAVLNSCSR